MADQPPVTPAHEKGIRRISSLMDAWWKVALILGSLILMVVSTVKSWMDIQASIKQSNNNKEDIKYIMEKYASKDEIKAVDEKVNKQYVNNNDLKLAITVLEKWVEFHKGYEQSRKDYNVKP